MMEWPLIVAVGVVLLFGGIIAFQFKRNRQNKNEISAVEHETRLRVAAQDAEAGEREKRGMAPLATGSVVNESKGSVPSGV